MDNPEMSKISKLDALIFDQIKSVFASFPEIKLAYFFGSRAADKAGPMSDYDFAFYADEKNKRKLFDLKLIVMDKISSILKTDKVDVVVLNLTESPELKYNILKEGKLILKREPYKVIVEPKILNEYFDFKSILSRNFLTKA